VAHLLITGGELIDGSGTPARPNRGVLIDGDADRIVAVGERAAADAPPEALRIDATGCTVLPGLIDAHCHSTFDQPASNDELFFHREPTLAALCTAHNLPKILRSGCTSIMDPDTIFRIGPSIRDALAAGLIEGPRMSTGVTALLTSVGGTAGRLIPDEGEIGYAAVVRTREEMVTETRRQIKEGADWIKIHATGSIPTKRGELQVWTLEEMAVVCDTAHALGVPVVAHCRNASSTRDAARAGVDLIYHASFLDEDALDAVAAAGSALCPTFTFLANLADYGHKVGAMTTQVDIFRGEIEATAKMMRRAYDAGVKLLCGSESGFSLTPYGHWHARELEVFVRYLGLSPVEAITCATRNGAIAMQLEGQLGTIEPGMLADVLVVQGDVARDVTLLQNRANLAAVISRGRPVDLTRPWPTRGPLAGERVGLWSAQVLTWDAAHAAGGAPA
jgi:imidazolonepropionase-like amidohydrolase